MNNKLDDSFVNQAISNGTDDAAELIPTFYNFLELRGWNDGIADAYQKHRDAGTLNEYFSSRRAENDLQELTDKLNEVAPYGTFFGTIDEDSSEWGFWRGGIEEELTDDF